MNRNFRWLLSALALVALLLVVAALVTQRYQNRLEREQYAPEQLQQRLRAVQTTAAGLRANDVDIARLREQAEARIRQMLVQDLSQSGHPDPAAAVALLEVAVVSMVRTEEGLLDYLERRLRALPDEEWSRTVLATDQWELSAAGVCLELRDISLSEPFWRWTSISPCDAD